MKMGMKIKVPVQDAWVGRAGSLPPPPAPLAELLGGGGMAGRVLPGDFEQRRGGSLASKPRVEMAGLSGE
jgi:hypothetical protein